MSGDNVSGLCSVGTTNMSALRGFVLVPSIIYLIAGAVLLSIGFVSLFRIRSSIRKGKISLIFHKIFINFSLIIQRNFIINHFYTVRQSNEFLTLNMNVQDIDTPCFAGVL